MPCKIEINREHIDIKVERDIVSGNRNKKLINFKFIATNDQDEVTGHFAGDYTNDNNIIILQNGELIFYRQNEASIKLIIEDNKIFELKDNGTRTEYNPPNESNIFQPNVSEKPPCPAQNVSKPRSAKPAEQKEPHLYK